MTGRALRLAVVVPRLEGGGAEHVATRWATWLRDSGHDVTVFVTSPQADLDDDRFRVVKLPGSFPRAALALRRHYRRERFDAALSLMPHWNLLNLLAAARAGEAAPATLISARNMARSLTSVFGFDYRVKQLLARRLYRRADAFVSISHPVAGEAISAYRLDPDRVFVVPNPALPEPRPVSVSPERADGHLDLVVPARLVAQKRPLLALETADALQRDHEVRATVHYFGQGPLEQTVRVAAAERGIDVVLHGWVRRWFDACPPGAVALLPSLSEGFGNVLVEAAAAGVPSVASSQALGVADAIVPGVTGELTPTSRPADLAAAVVAASRITIDPDLGWFERFSVQTSGTILQSVIDDCVGTTAR